MDPAVKRNIKRIMPFGPIWVIYGLIYVFLEKGLLGDSTIYPSTGNQYSFTEAISINPIVSLVVGWLFGAAEVLVFGNIFAKKPFVLKIALKTITYSLAICAFLILQAIVTNSVRLDLAFYDPEVVNTAIAFFNNFAFWSIVIYVGSIIGVTLFVHNVSDYLGLDAVKNFFTGKYHHPKEENRIFMFLDMKSSTTIAEELGHVEYFNLLNTCYSDISKSIIKTAGQIYQYVGDEIIVSWTLEKGLRKGNCIRCFFLIKETFEKLAPKYMDTYGVIPGFKAGIHLGQVTTGEIGKIKKEIVFSGDVLNTTSRIQGLCNQYKVDNLISGELLDFLKLEKKYEITRIGTTELRGKHTTVQLYSFSEKLLETG
jgi:adenylate cyclase